MAEPFCQNVLSSSRLESGPIISASSHPDIFPLQQNPVKRTITSRPILQICLQSSSIMKCEVQSWVSDYPPQTHILLSVAQWSQLGTWRLRKCTATHKQMRNPCHLLINRLAGLRIFFHNNGSQSVSSDLWHQNRQKILNFTKPPPPIITTRQKALGGWLLYNTFRLINLPNKESGFPAKKAFPKSSHHPTNQFYSTLSYDLRILHLSLTLPGNFS